MSQAQGPLAPFQTADNEYRNILFDRIRVEHYLPAIEEGIARARARVAQIKADPSPADFGNTIVALERSSEDLDLVAGVYFSLFGAHGTPEHQALADQISPLLAELDSDVSLDAELFARVEQVWQRREELGLDPESFRLLEKTWKGFVRNGARLPAEKQVRLRGIDQELSRLSPQFSQNLLKATNGYQLHLVHEDQLAGLPESVREAAAREARKRSLDGWVFTLHAPSMVPFLTYSDCRDLREQVWRAFNSRAYRDEHDNQAVLRDIVRLRHERAELLGYGGHADYVLEERMAERPQAVEEFLERLWRVSRPAAEHEVKRLQEFAAEECDGPERLMPWDFAYYSEKLKKKLYDFDEEALRDYFRLEAVIDGLFAVAGRLFGLEFQERGDLAVYHEEVRVFDVRRAGGHVGLLYIDLFPRETKQGGAWQSTFRDQGLWRGEVHRPHAAIVCNFTPSAPDAPSLLRLEEVTTLFHEFGHALHSLLSECRYQSTGGTSVYWDFVELPSQIMENWVVEKQALDLFARHYETGEPIPADLVEKVKQVRVFQAGWASLRQLAFGFLDMAWHRRDPGAVEDLAAFEDEVLARTQILPKPEGVCSSTAFAHIFAGGYASGYYSYKWAEVLEADAFERFKEEGIFNPETAESFRAHVLSRGNSAHPMELYVAFRGRRPDPDALLRRDGLLPALDD
jgi:peptidyl-dipeptidase Dcp